ncbi:MAG: ABC transporter permease [Odoribacteraceae bacterium]|jgi:ABC-2 type transport system permease protein|nr:ABC transporter permease [Odoribacteraceae bacterium]
MNEKTTSGASLFGAFTHKEIRHILRDRRTLLILLGIPVIQIVLFGFAITTEVRDVRVGILDPTPDVATRHITDRLLANDYFTFAGLFSSPAAVERSLRRGEIEMALVFAPSSPGRITRDGTVPVQLIADASDPNTAALFTGYATNIITAAAGELAGTPEESPARLLPEMRLLYNPAMRAAYNFVPGVMGLVLMLICAMMTSISIVREKESGTLELLLVSPVRPFVIIAAKIVPYLILSGINIATILLLSVYVLDVPVVGSLFWLVLVSLLFVLVSLSIGIFVSSIVRSQVAAMLISGMVLMMPVVLLSGLLFPVENMPILLRWTSHLIPAKWYIAAMKKIMIEGAPVLYILREILVLVGMGILLLLVSWKKFNDRIA